MHCETIKNEQRIRKDAEKESERKMREILENKLKLEGELKLKENQLLVMKVNSEKIASLHEQKFKFLEKEIENWKEKYESLRKEKEERERRMGEEIRSLKEKNERLKEEHSKKEQINNQQVNSNLTNLMTYVREHLKAQNEENKTMIEKIIKEKEKDTENDKELFKNFKEISQKNSELTLNLNNKDMRIRQLEEQNNKLNLYKEIIHNALGFKCKYCGLLFGFDSFQEHYERCQKNMGENNVNFNNVNLRNNINFSSPPIIKDKIKLKIINSKVKQDECEKPYLEYIIDVSYSGQNWRLYKKFTQFASLYKSLKSLLKGKMPMPQSANIFVNVATNITGSFHENKMQLLEKFIRDMAEIDVVCNSRSFRKFLEFEQYVEEGEGDYGGEMKGELNTFNQELNLTNINLDVRNNKSLLNQNSLNLKSSLKSENNIENDSDLANYNYNNRYLGSEEDKY